MKPTKPLHRREVQLLVDIVAGIARDDAATRANALLLTRGHPGAHDHQPSEAIGYPDPTGDLAAQGTDRAHADARRCERALAQAARSLLEADRIRANMTARANTETVADPTEWCRNCLAAGYCAPRTANGGLWCSWCRGVKQAYGLVPPPEIIHSHHEGRRVDRELTAYRARSKRLSRKSRARGR